MTHCLALLYHLENLGCQLKADGPNIRFRAPDSVLTDDMRERVRTHKTELIELLQLRRKFHYPEAVLFRLVGDQVSTPQGRGELLSVHRRYCRVGLERTGAVVLHPPAVLIALVVSEFAAAEVAA